MSDGAHFLAVKPLSVKTTRASCAEAVILNVMRHNARELQSELGIGADSGIDPSRVRLNVTLHGPATADGVASAARDAMREHGIVAPRKNATLGIEIVVSLPAGLPIDQLAYFRDATAWAQQHYGVPLLSAIVHNDESSPHLHLVLLPVRGGKLVGSELLGNRATMKAMQRDFHDQVAKQYGLRMPTAKKRHSAADRAAGIALLRDSLQANSSLTDRAIDALLVPHAKNPEPLLMALGLAIPAAPVKGSFVATMTRKMRPESPNRSFKKSPIGDFDAYKAAGLKAENEISYALLGLPISTQFSAASANPSNTCKATVDQRAECHQQATGQQASSRAAAQPSATGQQRARSTAGGLLSFQDTPLVVSTNPADHAASNSEPRKWATKPGRTDSTPATESATGTVLAVNQVDQLDGKRALQQAGHQHDAQDRAAADEQAAQHTSTEVGPATTARTKRGSTRGQDGTGPLPTGRVASASSSTGKRKRTASKLASTAQTANTVTAQHHPASDNVPENLGARASAPVTCSADQVGQTATVKRKAKTQSTGPAKLASTTTTKRELTVAKRSTGTTSTTSASPAGKHQAASIEYVTPSNATMSHATPGKRGKTAAAAPTSAPATLRDEKRKPATSAPSRVSSPAAVTSTASHGPASTDQVAAGAARTRRKPVSRLVAGSSPEPVVSLLDFGTDQQDEIRTLGLTPASSSGTTPPAGKTGEYCQTDENGRHDATTTAQRPALAPSTNGSATTPQAAPAFDVEPSPQCVMPEPARMAAQAPPIGGPLDGAGMLALEGDLQYQGGADDYDRHRDDDHPAEHWDEQRGEFVTAPAAPARRSTARPSWTAPDLGDQWCEARPSAVDTAMASVRAVCG